MAHNKGERSRANVSTEPTVVGIWAEVLERPEPLDLSADFFNLGGDSVAMMMVLFRVKDEFGIEVPPQALMECPTLREFCALVDTLRKNPTERGATEFPEGVV